MIIYYHACIVHTHKYFNNMFTVDYEGLFTAILIVELKDEYTKVDDCRVIKTPQHCKLWRTIYRKNHRQYFVRKICNVG